MTISLVQWFKGSRAILIIALSLLPLLVGVSRGKFGTARLAYRVYSITPLSLSGLASQSSKLAAIAAYKPNDQGLLKIVSARFAFDVGNNLDKWESITEDALVTCDKAILHGAPLEEVADLIFEALLLLFHPNIHQATLPSPFVDLPETTQSLMSHECIKRVQAFTSPPDSTSLLDADSGKNHTKQPVNILVLTDTNFNFMGPILSAWTDDTTISLRSRDLIEEGVDSAWWHPRNTILDRLSLQSPPPPDFLTEDLLWADIVFIEWSQALAARLSGVKLNASIVVRLHRYEAFIPTPTLTCWENVDTLLTISPYMSAVLARTVPGISTRTNLKMVPNVTNLRPFTLPKLPDASRTIGLIQYASIIKDPLWALEVLEILQLQDPEWNLKFVGSPYTATESSKTSNEYFTKFTERAGSFGDTVHFLGKRNDLPDVLRSVGVILSASRVEGAPVSVNEGIASGAFPVIRNWPIVKAVHAAESLYPSDWVVEDPTEAAHRILSWAANLHGPVNEAQSRNWAIDNFDAEVTIAQLNCIVFGRDTSSI